MRFAVWIYMLLIFVSSHAFATGNDPAQPVDLKPTSGIKNEKADDLAQKTSKHAQKRHSERRKKNKKDGASANESNNFESGNSESTADIDDSKRVKDPRFIERERGSKRYQGLEVDPD